MSKKTENYVNNKEFCQMLIDYKKACDDAAEKGEERPRIPEDIGTCFYLIAKKLATKSNFVGYTYKDEMVADALENCVVAVNNFNPEKSNNAFSYFTQIIWYAFLRRIEKEKRQTYVKYKALEHAVTLDEMEEGHGGAYANFDLNNEKMKPIIEKYEKKKEKKKPKGIENFTKEIKSE